MDWQSGQMSNDIEDRREDSGSGGGGFGGGGVGIVGVLVLLVVSLITGRNYLGAFLHGGGAQTAPSAETQREVPRSMSTQEEDRDAHLISWTLNDVQKFWTGNFEQHGREYTHAKLVLFRNQTYSGCGTAESATGPFYCPADQKVYIDLGFWDELKKFGGSTADFAQAYVIAHELGHHVQNLLGTEEKVQRLMRAEPSEKNHLSVDLELQADCYAGVWAHSAQQRGVIHDADIHDALSAAAAVGDDHLQKMSGRSVSPESWTHGSSQQRETWFKRGFTGGDLSSCNTFGGSSN
ncbi:MAG: neutral zinc metallopeptidase [Micavibrio sp.]|nr:neutral zinc metallopeptidase [Micavibrio sp.]